MGARASAGAPLSQRPARVRNRLVGYLAVVAVAVVAAGAPGVAAASADLTESQRLVSLSELNAQAVLLAHSLADERDTMTEYVAAGRNAASGVKGVSENRRSRVDRQVSEIRADAPEALRRVLARLPTMRQEALSGHGKAIATFNAYTDAVQALHAVSADLARRIPPRASNGPAEALPSLGRAVEQASATRALLLGALSGTDSQSQLTDAAQRRRVQERAALAEFEQMAPESAADRYANTVNGNEISTAERFLARLTDQPQLSSEDRALDRERVEATLSGRIDRMRAVESALTTAETARLAQLRDDDVTALELRIALAGVCLLLAVGISMTAARSMTRPLAVLRLGAQRVAADPVAEEPVRFTGRDDEFADAVRAVNELRETAVRLHARVAQLGDDRTRLIGERQRLADERQELQRTKEELAERLDRLQDRVHGTYVSLALRTLGLVERQLAVIEDLEESEQDPDQLDTLYKLDHLATRMRRHSENLLVLAGAEHGSGHAEPVPLLDVLRAAISETEHYERVQIQPLPPHARVAGFAADAISHLVAELLENAAGFSPPDATVQVSGWLLESGEVMLSVQDEGIGMTAHRLEELNSRLAEPNEGSADDEENVLGLGLYVVARLAARHGLRVQLREQKQGGVTAVVVLPKSILPTRPPQGAPTAAAATTTPYAAGASTAAGTVGGTRGRVSLPGSEAEANSNALPRRTLEPAVPQSEPESRVSGAGDSAEPESPAESPGAAVPPGQAHEEAGEQTRDPQSPATSQPDTDIEDGSETGADREAAPETGADAEDGAETGADSEDAAGMGADAAVPADVGLVPPPRTADADPLVSAAERAVAAAELDSAPGTAVSHDGDGGPSTPGAQPTDAPADVPPSDGESPARQVSPPAVVPLGSTAWAEADLGEKPGEVAPGGASQGGASDAQTPDGQDAEAPDDGGVAPAESWTTAHDTSLGAEGPAPTSALAPEQPVAPAADSPYAIGQDEHARAEDERPGTGTGDQPTQMPRPATADPEPSDADLVVGHPDGRTVQGTGPLARGEDAGGPADAAAAQAEATDPPTSADGTAPRWERVAAPEPPTAHALSTEHTLSMEHALPTEHAMPKEQPLPKRTPKVVAPTAAPHERTGRVDAEELRRRLGGFQQGARAGRRDAEAEIAAGEESAEGTGEHRMGALDEGGTVEEARG
ncbi:nitrate- and nitrite sensing domain-containing protein [Streptomyces sp. KR80]|uniref:nitrate- and nitrite sensing domain-containing protein n=1 Tax=Streptomyces sp. KR80 TaxID=3457426 RepID=UPI003FD3AC8F